METELIKSSVLSNLGIITLFIIRLKKSIFAVIRSKLFKERGINLKMPSKLFIERANMRVEHVKRKEKIFFG
jgi:hypothetical protein